MQKWLKRLLSCFLAAALLASCLSGPVRAAPTVSAASAVCLDAATGRVLYEKNASQKSLIASTTKIMTGLIIAETCDLSQPVCIPAEACGIEGSSLYLKPGETLTVEQLLYGMLLHSGNDAAMALALHCSGSLRAFVCRMNARAAQLGLHQTHFANPHGLDDVANYSTALDLARLAACAMTQPTFARIVSSKTARLPGRSLQNHNKLLWRYPDADGVKTGYTRAAGRILVSSAVRGSRRLIAVTMQAPDDWNDHVRLLDAGFAAFTPRRLLAEGQQIGALPVVGGTQAYCDLVAAQTVCYPVAAGEQVHVRLLAPRFLYAPVTALAPVAQAELWVDGALVATCPLLAKQEIEAAPVEKPSVWQRIFG